MLVICVALCFIIYLIQQKWRRRDLMEMERQLNPGLFYIPFAGHSYLLLGDAETRMKGFQTMGRDALRNSTGLTAFRHGPLFYTVVADPTAVEVILKTCLEKDDIMKMAKTYLGNGSIFAPVSIWRLRRKVLVPSFGTKNLKHFMSIFSKQSSILMYKLKHVASKGTFSIFNFFTAYTMDSIAEASLGYKMNAQFDTKHPFLQAFDRGLNICSHRLCRPWLHYDFIFTKLPAYRQLIKDKEYLWNFISELIKSKREEMKIKEEKSSVPSGEEDGLKCFLELLINSSGGEDGYTNIEVIEEVMVIMIAGNDTTAVAASFVSMMLAKHPEIQDNIYQELRQVFGASNRPPSADDLIQLKYLDAVIRETLRLYPPVPIITRKVDKDVKLPCGIKLVPNSGVLINIWALHRNQQYWGDDAEEFYPERFLDIQLKHPAAFIPFSHGPRNCVGYQFAMTSMKMMLSLFLRQYKILPSKLAPDRNEHIRLRFDLMMKDVDNFPLEIELRA